MALTKKITKYHRATGALRVLPDFIIIGAQKCGTTSLYEYLAAHPSVVPAYTKEVHYFDKAFGRGTMWYRAHFPTVPYRLAKQVVTGQRLLVGEASPLYLFHPHVPKRVRALLPKAKLIALLRDPVERAYSAYQMQVRRRKEALSFSEAIDRQLERLGVIDRLPVEEMYKGGGQGKVNYLARGIYVDQLAAWFQLFPREQLLVVNSEQFFSDTAGVFSQVLDFLGLPPWQPARWERFNGASYSGMEPATRRRLQNYFAPHNDRLYELLGCDFGWPR